MANFVFTESCGHVSEMASRVIANDPAGAQFEVLLLVAPSGVDATIRDYDDVAAVLGDVNVAESIATDYVRKNMTDAVDAPTRTVDDTNDRIDIDSPDITWTGLGNGVNSSLTDLMIAFDETGTDTDANMAPCTWHDFVVTTDNSDVTAQIANFFRATAS